jgi:energy-coupling factor transporter ATP-binding protein EcfA2
VIEIADLTYTYPATSQPALNNINLNIPAGQFCAVIGPNGAGKSTLCYALAGLIPHFYRGHLTGRVHVAGHDIPHTPLSQLAGEIGLVFQNPFNQITGARFSVTEEVGFGLENLGIPPDEMRARIADTLALVGLEGLADRPPLALSGGQQQRLAIASVLVMRPRVLVLDEPTSQLDPVGVKEVFATLSKLAGTEMTVVLVTQHLEWAATYAQRIVALVEGRLVADGPPREVLTSPLMDEQGIGATLYTRAARQAQAAGLISADRPLPVTLDDAIHFFQA